MDSKRFRQAKTRLEALEDRRTYAIRSGSSPSLIRPGTEEIEQRLRELASYTLELKEILSELFEAIDSPS